MIEENATGIAWVVTALIAGLWIGSAIGGISERNVIARSGGFYTPVIGPQGTEYRCAPKISMPEEFRK